jgi:hypothetical protein
MAAIPPWRTRHSNTIIIAQRAPVGNQPGKFSKNSANDLLLMASHEDAMPK